MSGCAAPFGPNTAVHPLTRIDPSSKSRECPKEERRDRRGRRRGRRPRRRQRMQDETTIKTSHSMYNTRGGSKDSCPGGSLEACFSACPSSERGFKLCTAICDRRCSKKWYNVMKIKNLTWHCVFYYVSILLYCMPSNQPAGGCTQEKYEDKLDFYILALWIAHL